MHVPLRNHLQEKIASQYMNIKVIEKMDLLGKYVANITTTHLLKIGGARSPKMNTNFYLKPKMDVSNY